MLDQSAIDDLLEGITPGPGLGEIDLEELAEITEQQESLSSDDVSALLDKAEELEELGASKSAPTAYDTVEESEVLELEEELKKARELKKAEDVKEVERLKLQGRAGNNENKKKPTVEEIKERLIDSDEADDLDQQLKNLKNRDA